MYHNYKQITINGDYWTMYDVAQKLESKGWLIFSLREQETILTKANKMIVLEIQAQKGVC